MSHTPGPWRYDEKRCAILVGEDKEENGFVVEPATKVLDLYGAMGGDDTDADARLITAAPELLEALNKALGAPHCPFCGANNVGFEGRGCINKDCAGVRLARKIEGRDRGQA